jgi:Abortive infection alpha
MDQARANEAHPAFPIIIKQLASDEAIILATLDGTEYDFIFTRDLNTKMLFDYRKIEKDDLQQSGLSFPENIPFYMEHLDHLGLAKIVQQGNQERLHNAGRRTGVRVRCKYILTDTGKRFIKACRS